MKKSVLIIVLSLVLAIGFTAPSFAGKKICKLGHVNSPASLFQYAALIFKANVEKELPDWTIEVYPAGQLGGSLAMIQGLTLGTVDIYSEFLSVFADLVPEYKVFAVHYKFNSVDEYELFLNSPTFAAMNEKMIKTNGITTIGSVDSGAVYNHFSNTPLYKVDDAKGLVGRVAQMAPLVACWKSYGAKPTSMDWGEIYTSLQTGVVSALDNPILDMYDEKFHEAIKYVNMTGNLVNMIDYQTSYAFWKKLSEKEKDVFKRAIRSASIKTKMEVDRRLDAVKIELESKGIKFIDTDTSGFKTAIVENIDTILEGNKDAINTYQAIVNGKY